MSRTNSQKNRSGKREPISARQSRSQGQRHHAQARKKLGVLRGSRPNETAKDLPDDRPSSSAATSARSKTELLGFSKPGETADEVGQQQPCADIDLLATAVNLCHFEVKRSVRSYCTAAREAGNCWKR